jgi:hypothetical protein
LIGIHRGRDRIVVGFTTPMQSVYITTKIVSLNPVHDKEYSIQYYVIKFVQQLAAGQWFSPGTPVSSINKNDHHDITEILLKVVLNTINPPPPPVLIVKCLVTMLILYYVLNLSVML